MAIQIIAPDRDTNPLRNYLLDLLPQTAIYNLNHSGDPVKVKMAVLWKQPPEALAGMKNLKAIHSLGAGVDHLIVAPAIPKHLPIARIVDNNLTQGMRRYVLMAILNFHKNLYDHLTAQRSGAWTGLAKAETPLRIGMLGLGKLGKAIAVDLIVLGFEVAAYTRSAKKIGGIRCFSAEKGELSQFLGSVNTIVCLLPLTAATKDLMDWNFFQQLPDQSYLINVGRGQHLVDADLLKAIEQGKIRGACLDVLREEPLPKTHPFWHNPAVILTPHIASVTDQQEAAKQIAINYKRMESGQSLLNQIDRQLGY
jgi:glyoxylate/hydroxypyruvate reductase A